MRRRDNHPPARFQSVHVRFNEALFILISLIQRTDLQLCFAQKEEESDKGRKSNVRVRRGMD